MSASDEQRALRAELEVLYRRYNRARFRATDPVETLHRYPDPLDREWMGMIVAGLAYGRVASIRASVRDIAARLGPHPDRLIRTCSSAALREVLSGFRHRWTGAGDVADMLLAAREAVGGRASIGECLAGLIGAGDPTIRPALIRWTTRLRQAGPGPIRMWADPAGPSACKRLHLYLRWMTRRDAIDAGGWESVPARLLIVPVDVHMHRIGTALGFTRRRSADARTADEITAGFAAIRPDDPARYDFALTRPGIMAGLRPQAGPPGEAGDPAALIRELGREAGRGVNGTPAAD